MKKKRIYKAQKMFQGFKDLGSLSSVWLFMSFNCFFCCFSLICSFSLFWSCPLTFEFLRLFCLFGFLTAFSSLLIVEISLALVWGVILVGISYENFFIQAQEKTDTIKRLMSYPKCKSVEIINNSARPRSNHREVNYINYK